MGFEISDGKGKGNSAEVDSTNRLRVRSISEDILQAASEVGDAYFFGTPLITLTTAGESAIFYLKNEEDFPLVLANFFLVAESTTGGSPDMFRVNWYKNSTGISGGTANPPLNQNFGSSKTLNVSTEFGADGSTITGGALAATLSFPIGVFNNFEANLVLEKGSSFVISITPPTGNTSMAVQFGSRSILNTNV